MEHSRKQKLLVVLALVVAIASLSIGFAAFSVSLNISSSASVTPNSDSFSVKFSSVKGSTIADGEFEPSLVSDGATGTNGIIDNSNNPTVKNLGATFTKPGQSVEYMFFIRNVGEYIAYLNSVSFIGDKTCVAEEGTSDELVQMACDNITMYAKIAGITFTETESVTDVEMAPVGSWIVAKIYLTYDSNGVYVDGPFSITFPQLSLVFSSIDDPTIKPTVVRLESGDLNTPGSIVSIGNERFYVIGQDNGNVKLLSMYNLHVGNSVDEVWNVMPLASPTGIQDSSARGYVNGKFPLIGTTAFSDTSTSYSGSLVEGYINNYMTYLEGMDANIASARLITEEELKTLGCNREARTCSGAPSWVYSTTYWMDLVDDPGYVGIVSTILDFGITSNFNNSSNLGVRPVIEIPLSEFE